MANPGRKPGGKNTKAYKWRVSVYDKESNSMKTGRYFCLDDMKKDLDVNWTNDIIRRLHSRTGVDETKKLGDNAFLNKYGHIHLEKINEKA